MKVKVLDLNFLSKKDAIAAFLVIGKTGVSLVETGPHSTFEQLRNAVEAAGYQLSDLKHVFLSHIHFDHAGAAWALADLGAKIYVHPKGLPHLAAPEKLYNSARQIYKEQMDSLWGAMYPIPEAQLFAPAHGEKIDAGGVRFTAWYTPGHAVHHIAWEAKTIGANCKGAIFTGDVAGVKIGKKGIAVPPCPPPDIHVGDWLASIELLKNLPTQTMYLTHFGKVTDKLNHLNTLADCLHELSGWMLPHFQNQTPQEEIVPLFKNFMQEKLKKAGIPSRDLEKYEAANPSFMAVAGLMRYWFKHSQIGTQTK